MVARGAKNLNLSDMKYRSSTTLCFTAAVSVPVPSSPTGTTNSTAGTESDESDLSNAPLWRLSAGFSCMLLVFLSILGCMYKAILSLHLA